VFSSLFPPLSLKDPVMLELDAFSSHFPIWEPLTRTMLPGLLL